MTYDFTSIMNRHGMDSIAVDGLGTDPGFAPDPPREGFDVIPMWVADMNFPTVPTIPQAIIERAVLLQCLFDRFGSVFPQCGLMVFPGVVIVSR